MRALVVASFYSVLLNCLGLVCASRIRLPSESVQSSPSPNRVADLLGALLPFATPEVGVHLAGQGQLNGGRSLSDGVASAFTPPRASSGSSMSEAASGTPNAAFVFVKPHAVTEKAIDLVRQALKDKGIRILAEGSISSKDIDKKKLIDKHYYAIASKATILKPSQLNVPADKFKDAFGVEWADALASGKVFNAMDACKHLGIDAAGLDAAWKKATRKVKLGGGFYCGIVDTVEGKEPIYVFNAFFMSMRSKFTAPGGSIYYFSVEWDSAATPWADFRGKVLGPTDPAQAPRNSIRGTVLKKWQELGLSSEPNQGDNAVHASASPFEGLAERVNWLGTSIADDPFGKPLIEAGVPLETVKAWTIDPVVPYPDGSKGSVFDALEDLDADVCITKALELHKAGLG